MFKSLPPLVLLAVLAGCSSAPGDAAGVPAQVAKPRGGCAQSEWQAQTAPVINKRQGNEALEQYASDTQEQGSGCR